MVLCIPKNNKCKIDYNKALSKLLKRTVLKGVYTYYGELYPNMAFRVVHGQIGWNLFVCEHNSNNINIALEYLNKNYKYLNELLSTCKEYIIDIYIVD